MNVSEVLTQTAQRYPSKPAIVFRDNPITFSGLRDTVFQLADGLLKLGIKKSDRVAVYLPNCPEYVYSYLALFSIGATVVPLDFMLTEEELANCLNHCQGKALIAKEKESLSLVSLKSKVASLADIIVLGSGNPGFNPLTGISRATPVDEWRMGTPPLRGSRSFEEILSKGSAITPDIKIDDKDPALIMYTSGTTGQAKGILLNYRHLDGTPEAMKHFVDLSDQDVKISPLPLSHSGGLIYIQNCIVFGITLILMERFQPLEFLKNIQKYRVTCFHMVPSMYYAILHLKEFESFDLSSLRWLVVFGAPSDPHSLRRFHQYCPNAHLLNGWGMTETCPPNTVIPLGSKKIESVGVPAPNCQVRIVAEDNRQLQQGEVGEIVIKGWVVMDGYYKEPRLTEEVMRDGWFHTGDLGRFDEEGFLYIVGRKKDMIKVSGEIVYSFEVENALLKHAAVQEAAVVGMPDRLRGEMVKAFVVFKKEVQSTPEELRSFCREHLAHFKVPHSIEVRDSLPKTPSGKIQKEKLKAQEII